MTATTQLPPADPGGSIWRDGSFVRLWAASSISYVGSFITRTALPLTAIYLLDAGALEISFLRSVELVGWLLVGLVAGAWVDRLRRRPVMIWADLGRAVLLISIPIAAVLDVLTLAHLIVVAFLAALLSTFFNSASTAYLPTLVSRAKLLRANSALSASQSVAEFSGFAISGFLIQRLGGPIAIGIDAVSYVISALFIRTIRHEEPPPPPVKDREPVLREIREGIRIVAHQPILRALAAAHAGTHVLWGVFGATYLLFATEEIGLGAEAIGLVAAMGGLSSFFGAAIAPRVVRRIGVGPAMIVGLAGMTIGNALIPLAPAGAVLVGTAFLVGQQLIGDSSSVVYDVVEQSVTQSIVDDRILGRVNATVEFITTLLALVGSILGGIVAELYGLRVALSIGLVGAAASVVIVWLSPARHLRTIPDEVTVRPLRAEDLPLTE